MQKLTCESHGGNPLATLKWYKGQKELKEGLVVSKNGNIVSAELPVLAKESDNGAVYKCTATNSATTKQLTEKVKLSVHCKYTH